MLLRHVLKAIKHYSGLQILVTLCIDGRNSVAYTRIWQIVWRFTNKRDFKIEYNIRASLLLNLLKSLRKSDKILSKPRVVYPLS